MIARFPAKGKSSKSPVSIPKTVVADQGTIFFEGCDFPPSEAYSGGWGLARMEGNGCHITWLKLFLITVLRMLPRALHPRSKREKRASGRTAVSPIVLYISPGSCYHSGGRS